ncbi:MAG: TldD/PmbA family protein [Candidatus Hodarchaeales archaeon]
MTSTVNENLYSIVDGAVSFLEKTNAEDIIVFGQNQTNFQLRFSKNEITVSKRWANLGIQVYFVKDKKISATFLSDLSSMDAVTKSLDELIAFSKALPPKNDYGGIAEGPFEYKEIKGLYDKKIQDFSSRSVDYVEAGINSAMNEGALLSAGILEWGYTKQFMKSNHGVELEDQSSYYQFLIRSFFEATESGQGLCVGRMLDTLDVEQAGKTAGEIAKMSVGGKPVKGGKFNALLSPTVVADIVARTISDANPFAIEIGQSWLRDKLGEQISSEKFTAWDDATIPNGFNSRIADAEGVPSQKTTIIEKGVLKNLIHNTSTAKKAGTVSTSNAGLISPQNSNIVISPGTYSFDELIEECREPTIYVTSNWYTRSTNAAEGVFSTIPRDGMFLIENGKIKRPVRELRISDSFPNLIKNIKAIQNKTRQIKWWLEVTTPTFAPAILIENVNFSTGTR